jgi:hypothetical protein
MNYMNNKTQIYTKTCPLSAVLATAKHGNISTMRLTKQKLCSRSEIEHRLTQPATPKTNGMVERVNGTIKKHTKVRYTSLLLAFGMQATILSVKSSSASNNLPSVSIV